MLSKPTCAAGAAHHQGPESLLVLKIFVFRKGGKGVGIPTGEYIK